MNQPSIIELITQSGPVVKFVLIGLLLSSLFCWSIIFSKFKIFKIASQKNKGFEEMFWNSKSLEEAQSEIENYKSSPVAHVFINGYRELLKLKGLERQKHSELEINNIYRAMAKASSDQVEKLEENVGWLATIASAAPFIGLFGTVWGIMNSFQSIGSTGSASLAVVAPGISEALIATAAGLAAAIPSVVAYNHFVNKIKKQANEMDHFSQDFLNIVQRSFLGSKKGSEES
ncbi:MAG: protein TolQ [Bdellovibrionaceae bacterium]|nr:protein TolQ [Pseudobdellovibrionaceae bacterium]|tara:strand:- start:954 stop:1646 length:693 start_codon:yes stop_codon:yes gene_type:complete